jgi:hypothetical protein
MGSRARAFAEVVFYSTAASLLALLLLTGVVGQMRALSDLEPEERKVWAYGFLVVFLVVAAAAVTGEYYALRVLAGNRTVGDHTSRMAVTICLLVGSASVVGLALLATIRHTVGRTAVERFAAIGGSLIVLAGMATAGVLLVVIPTVKETKADLNTLSANNFLRDCTNGPASVFGSVGSSESVNVRSRPSNSARVVTTLQGPCYVPLTCVITELSERWYELTGGVGFVRAREVAPVFGQTAQPIPICPRP